MRSGIACLLLLACLELVAAKFPGANYDGAVFIIMDGTGETSWLAGNAAAAASTPFLDSLKADYPYMPLIAAGWPVGVRRTDQGSSIVGHQTLGSGRVVPWYPQRTESAVLDGTFYTLDAFEEAFALPHNRVHLVGEFDSVGINSDIRYLPAFLEVFRDHGVASEDVFMHMYIGGDAVDASVWVAEMEEFMLAVSETPGVPYGTIASAVGDDYAMDRVGDWDRTEVVYNALVCGDYHTNSPEGMLADTIDQRVLDVGSVSSVLPIGVDVSGDGSETHVTFEEGDMVVTFNWRADGMFQVSHALYDPENYFTPQCELPNLNMVPYSVVDPELVEAWPNTLFDAVVPERSLGAYVSELGLTQARVGESYKRRHIECFFSGSIMYKEAFEGEDRYTDIESPADHLANPEMRDETVTETALTAITSGDYDLVAVNLAAADASGHTGDFDAALTAVEKNDECVERLVTAALAMNYAVVVTADHGNSEEMTYLSGAPQAIHSLNHVPFMLMTPDKQYEIKPNTLGSSASIASVAPTLLDVMGWGVPDEMDGFVVARQITEIPSNGRLIVTLLAIGFGLMMTSTVLLAIKIVRMRPSTSNYKTMADVGESVPGHV
ncbi:hypothetical protein KIPB_006669 [Kipferlia bialata]|uniref:phosphoglycerate mutase (2,3-diphosphoglycerate-independent) n=1 Tax=Kipferlia bialata TaxID=797122 RepID=A0A9K3CZJ4_9EUKA|nr:hypothetical protein KIPB_006669 [Kipferlia bialata]|eukprot:g6669.t1